MKEYKRPCARVMKFEIENIITVSGVITQASKVEGEELKMYEKYAENSSVGNTSLAIFTW